MTKASIAPKQIASAIAIDYPDLQWIMQDIYNLHHELKAELMRGKSSIEAMLYELETKGLEFNYQLNENSHITLLFFVYSQSLFLLK